MKSYEIVLLSSLVVSCNILYKEPYTGGGGGALGLVIVLPGRIVSSAFAE